MANNDSYISLRKSLDSFSDVALAEFALIELDNEKNSIKSDEETKKFSDFVSNKVTGLLEEIAARQQAEWLRLNTVRAKKFKAHADELLKNARSACPPGFHEVNGHCIPITLL